MYSCLCTLGWLCWCCAITGLHVLKLIKFSDKHSQWNVHAAVCLQRGPVQRLETSRNLGLSGAGPPGDMKLTLGHCIWAHPPFVSPFNPQYVLCNNIPHHSSVLLNLLVSSEISFYVKRSFGKSSLGGPEYFICFHCKSCFLNCKDIGLHLPDSIPLNQTDIRCSLSSYS